MGILSDPKTREKLLRIVSNHNNKLCFICYVAGVIWFAALAYRPLNAGTYFSENALLPGLVEAEFYSDHGATDSFRSLKDEIRKRKNSEDKDLVYELPTNWLVNEMQAIGLDTYVQNYSFQYPVNILKGQKFHGQNVYGILRAMRTASTEALILSAPFRPPDVEEPQTNAGIALLMGIARAFRKRTYWAKDIIFLVTDNENIGMQAWLNAYHEISSEYIHPGELAGRSGSIQAAINLEIATDKISKFNIKLEGVNGQLPNLDLVNTVVRLCRREGIVPTLYGRGDYWDSESFEGWEHAFRTMLSMMWHQAQGQSTGNHGLLHKYHIEAITLNGIKEKGSRKLHGFVEMGRVIEGVYRSLNNLLERFHQSFFFYLLPATERYVSIGLYMPAFGLMALPVLIKALALWIHVSLMWHDQHEAEEAGKEGTQLKDGKQTSVQEENLEEKNETYAKDSCTELKDKGKSRPTRGLTSIVPVCIMAAFFGVISHAGPSTCIDTAHPFRIPPTDALGWGALALLLSTVMFPKMMIRKEKQKGDSGANPHLLKCVGLLILGVVLGATSVLNISLAFFLALIWTPVVLIVWPSSYRFLNGCQYLFLLLISPIGLIYCFSLLHEAVHSPAAPLNLHLNAWDLTQRGLLQSVLHNHLYGNWMFSLVTLALTPTWTIFWALMWTHE